MYEAVAEGGRASIESRDWRYGEGAEGFAEISGRLLGKSKCSQK